MSHDSEPNNAPSRPSSVWRRAWRSLPMLKRYPVIAGAVAGVLLRLVFSGAPQSQWSAMAAAFIYIAPILVGMVTVYLAERQRRRDWAYYVAAPCLACVLFVSGTMLIMIEGLICAIVIIPMFAVLGALGGLVMGTVCRLTNWPRPMLYSFGALPILLASIGSVLPTPTNIGSIERSVVISAPAAAVWRQLNHIDNIRPDEMAHAWAMRIGVPLPVSGKTRQTPQGLVRESRWGKMVHFDEVIHEWQPERYMRWTYRFAPDSFPRQALDDHVVIGGHYFDLIDTSYTLAAEGNATRLTTRVQYRISTQFNFYADWAAQFLLGNLCEVGLHLYKGRSEREGLTLLSDGTGER
jgi:hypothetical protein